MLFRAPQVWLGFESFSLSLSGDNKFHQPCRGEYRISAPRETKVSRGMRYRPIRARLSPAAARRPAAFLFARPAARGREENKPRRPASFSRGDERSCSRPVPTHHPASSIFQPSSWGNRARPRERYDRLIIMWHLGRA